MNVNDDTLLVETLDDIKKETRSRRNGLIVFFLFAFGISWLLQLPKILDSYGIITLPLWLGLILGGIATFGPTIAAIITIAIFEDKKEIVNLFKKGIKTKFKKIWFIPIFLFLPTLAALSLFTSMAMFGNNIEPGYYQDAGLYIGVIIIAFFVGGALGEEFGWRGYALEKLQVKNSSLTASLILGFLWGLWHLPLHFIADTTQSYIPIWAFILLTILFSILYTWIYNNTNNSVLAVILFHWISNIAGALLPYWQIGLINEHEPNYYLPTYGMIVGFIITLIATVAIIITYKMHRKIRDRIVTHNGLDHKI